MLRALELPNYRLQEGRPPWARLELKPITFESPCANLPI